MKVLRSSHSRAAVGGRRGGDAPVLVARCVATAGAVAFMRRKTGGFSLLETMVALGMIGIGFLGAFAMVLQSGRLVSAAEEDTLVCSGLEQRIDQLRTLEWPELTDGTGLTTKVWTARPEATAGLTVADESIVISGYDVPTAKPVQGTWANAGSPSVSLGAGVEDLSTANAVQVVVSLAWTGRRSGHAQARSLLTVISRGGISKSDRP